MPNLSTSLYFVVNDQYYKRLCPRPRAPEGVIVGSLEDVREKSHFIGKYYAKLANKGADPSRFQHDVGTRRLFVMCPAT